MANSSATRSGGLYSGRALPMTAILQRLRALGQRGGDEVGRRHQAVGVLVVLVDADAVEAELVGVGERVDVFAVEVVAFDRDRRASWAARPRRSRTSASKSSGRYGQDMRWKK